MTRRLLTAATAALLALATTIPVASTAAADPILRKESWYAYTRALVPGQLVGRTGNYHFVLIDFTSRFGPFTDSDSADVFITDLQCDEPPRQPSAPDCEHLAEEVGRGPVGWAPVGRIGGDITGLLPTTKTDLSTGVVSEHTRRIGVFARPVGGVTRKVIKSYDIGAMRFVSLGSSSRVTGRVGAISLNEPGVRFPLSNLIHVRDYYDHG